MIKLKTTSWYSTCFYPYSLHFRLNSFTYYRNYTCKHTLSKEHSHFFSRTFSTSFYYFFKRTNLLNNFLEVNILNDSYNWKNFISKEYNVITPTCLEYELKRFFHYFDLVYKNQHFAIIFKIKFPNGHFRSCSYVQVSNILEFDKLYSVFAYIFTLENFADKVSEEHNKDELFVDNFPKGNIYFCFKVIEILKRQNTIILLRSRIDTLMRRVLKERITRKILDTKIFLFLLIWIFHFDLTLLFRLIILVLIPLIN